MPKDSFCRRSFLKMSLLTAAALCTGSTPAWARHVAGERKTAGRLRLRNTHTGERLVVTYRDRYGNYDQNALDELNWLLRCHYNNEVHPIDIRTIEFLNSLHKNIRGEHEIQVISGYRSPEYNALLRSKSRGVAKHSLHLEGKALDIRISDVRLSTLRKTALNLRMGGVGYYPKSGFLHIDSGSFRTW
ncbi:MAG: YcbK family protein [Thermodesulfobacteriota bacterium]